MARTIWQGTTTKREIVRSGAFVSREPPPTRHSFDCHKASCYIAIQSQPTVIYRNNPPTVKNRQEIYFLHIPKTAGLSMRSMFELEYASSLCPSFLWDHFFLDQSSRTKSYSAYFGHFGNDLGSFLGREMPTATMLREPVARTVSHYLHVKRDVHHPYHRYMVNHSLSDFVNDPVTIPMVFNLQARYLVKSGLQIDALAKRFDTTCLSKSGLQIAWENSSFVFGPAALLDLAQTSLRSMDFVCTTDQFDLGAARLADHYCFQYNQFELRNVAPETPERPQLDNGVLSRIRALTEVDEVLFSYAKSQC
jgi:hypothetical protein